MAKLIIKSYQSRGWLVPFFGDDYQKIFDYCKKNGEEIEFFSPNEYEDTYREEIIDDFDVYEAATVADCYALTGSSIVLDENTEIFISENGKESPLSLDQIIVEKNKITVSDFISDEKGYLSDDEQVNFKGIAYSFGYNSDNIIEVELKIRTCDDKFDLKKLIFKSVKNEFFEDVGEYVSEIEYRDDLLDIDDFEDIDGDYYNPGYFELK